MRILLLAILLLSGLPQDPQVPDLTLEDTTGRRHALPSKTSVYVFLGTECPMANRYLPRLADLHKKFVDVAFFGVNSSAFESVEAIAKHAKDMAVPFPVLLDRDQKLADALKARLTPTAFVVDARRRVRYRGLIDDNKAEELAKKRHLRDAIEAVLAGKDVEVPETEPVGCTIQRPLDAKEGPVTYASHAAKILNEHCVACHRPGQVAPFSLTNYADARRWARDAKRYVLAGAMPPWKPANDGQFRGERRLSKEEIDALSAWADAGAPPGDLAAAPPPPKFPEGWMLGDPDLVLEAPGDWDVDPEGADEYRCFVLDPKLTEDRYVRAVEFRPGNARIVHHVMTYIDAKGDAVKFDESDPKLGYSSSGTGPGFMPLGDLGGWGPGMQPTPLEDGTGYFLPKGARIVMEVHYHRNGRKEKDRTKIGLHFAKGAIRQRVRSHVVLNMSFLIPAGAKRHRITASWKVNEDLHAVAVIPHMHLLGKEIEVTATLPDGSKKSMVHIREWDFNWQESYLFRKPFALPAGTLVRVTGWFDNSPGNPNNPRVPPRNVGFGEQTTDEMCVAYIAYVRDRDNAASDK